MGLPSAKLRRWASLALFALVAAAPCLAQEPASCPIRFYRWYEDCRDLAGADLRGIDALRLVPLAPDLVATFGGELRAETEDLSAPNFGIRRPPRSDTVGYRAYLHGDVHWSEGPRIFLQLLSADEIDRSPLERPFDRDVLDVAQAFIDLPLALPQLPVLLRVGRQELDLAGNRLVAIRDLANVRRAFDLALIEARPYSFTIDLFGGRPVFNNVGLLNDHGDPHESFVGLTVEHPVVSAPGTVMTAGIFIFRRTRAQAVYAEGIGRDDRDTFGARVHGNIGAFELALQGAMQRGTFAQLAIEASGIAMDTGWRFAGLPWQPRLGISGGRASGDHRRGDGKLGTFDPLYPNLAYFTDASPIYPGNDADLEPNVTVTPVAGVTLQAGIDILWRVSNQDAIYVPPGIPLVAGTGQPSHHEVSLPYLRGSWTPNPYWQFDLSYVDILPGSLLTAAGGHRAEFVRAAATTRF